MPHPVAAVRSLRAAATSVALLLVISFVALTSQSADAGTPVDRALAASRYRVLVSSSPDRSGATALNGRTIAGNVYVFVTPTSGLRSVAFSLDGSVKRVEGLAPFDFAGTAGNGTAQAFNASTLSPGAHVIAARLSDGAGSSTLSATFNVAGAPSSPTPRPPANYGSRPFSANSPFNTPIPSSPIIDPASSGIASALGSGSHIADLYEFGVPVNEADASTPKYQVNCTQNWGDCALERQPVPIPAGARASSGSDGAMVVVDRSARKVYEFWQYNFNGGNPVTSWGSVNELDGDGRGGGAVGAGISRLAGVVRASELQQGNIPHALVFSTDSSCPSVFRFPATKTDGRSWNTPCIPEGARLQLDPSLNVDTLPGLSPGERTIARALQTYGAYNIDNGGARMAFIFEDTTGKPNPYPSLGLSSDYFSLNRLPWQQLRLLRQWDGR